MVDISMCLNYWCPHKDTCYRYQAKPNEYWQSYSSFTPDENGICMYYIEYIPGEGEWNTSSH